VAGAGASREAGLPLGDELREQIRDAVDPRPERLSDQGAGRFFRKGFNLLPNRNTYGELELYDKARDRLYRGMQTAVSIDNFLDNHYNDKHLNACGKLAIASCILQAEANSKVKIEPGNIHNNIKFDALKDTWFQLFFFLLQLSTPFECLSARLKRLAIITFNYDRCIEHYLHSAIRNHYDVSPEDAASALTNLKIIHAYGSLGSLPWQSGADSIDFAAEKPTLSTFVENALALKTFTETTNDDDEQLKELRQIMRSPEKLVFLGFAYYTQNMELLFPAKQSPQFQDSVKRIYGTAYNLSGPNVQEIQTDIVKRWQINNNQIESFPNDRCFELLNRYSRSFELPYEDRPQPR
jgi:hypothetical protein